MLADCEEQSQQRAVGTGRQQGGGWGIQWGHPNKGRCFISSGAVLGEEGPLL